MIKFKIRNWFVTKANKFYQTHEYGYQLFTGECRPWYVWVADVLILRIP